MSHPASPKAKQTIEQPTNDSPGRQATFASPRNSETNSQSPAKRAAKSVLAINEQAPNFYSASTLQHHAASYRFPQADRFPAIKSYGPHCYSGSPTSMSGKGTTMGYGSKVDVINYTNKEAQLFPSPDRYNLKSDFDVSPTKGKSPSAINIPSEKSTDMHGPFPTPKNIPGPGAYNVQKDILSDITKISMKPRGKMFNEGLGLNSPKCNQYSPTTNLVLPTRHSQPGFGYGQKYDFTKPKNDNPGPGAYQPAQLSFGPTKKDVSEKISGSYY